MLRYLLRSIRDRLQPVRTKGTNNSVAIDSKIGRGFRMMVSGNNNEVVIGKNCILSNTTISISGDNNRLIIRNKARFYGPCQILLGGDGELIIGENAGIRGVEFNVEHGRMEIGELCMFSYGITLRNHDSHCIIEPKSGDVLNPTKDVVLGRHVWVGQNATILKGCNIGADSVIGFGSIVTKNCPPGSVMTGIPAKIVKENINWDY